LREKNIFDDLFFVKLNLKKIIKLNFVPTSLLREMTAVIFSLIFLFKIFRSILFLEISQTTDDFLFFLLFWLKNSGSEIQFTRVQYCREILANGIWRSPTQDALLNQRSPRVRFQTDETWFWIRYGIWIGTNPVEFSQNNSSWQTLLRYTLSSTYTFQI
jgi:hypothetical protein